MLGLLDTDPLNWLAVVVSKLPKGYSITLRRAMFPVLNMLQPFAGDVVKGLRSEASNGPYVGGA